MSSVLVGSICLLSSMSALAHSVHSYKGEELPLNPVTIPVFKGGFEFGLGALYLRPSSSNLDYITNQATSLDTNTVVNNEETVDPSYNWGFILQLGYIFPHTANDIQLNWMHLHTNSEKDSAIVHGSAVGPIIVIPALSFPMSLLVDDTFNEKAKVKYKFDALDLVFGQYINFGARLQTKLYGGLRWSKLENDIDVSYQGTGNFLGIALAPSSTTFTGTEKIDSTFNGIGPVFGVSANYELGRGFGIAGNIDLALLVGKISMDQSASIAAATAPGDETPAQTTFYQYPYNTESLHVIAPAFDAKLGLNYSYFMKNGSLIKAELGYQDSRYFNVIGVANVANNSTDPEFFGIASTPLNPTTTQFGLSGPYFTVTLKV